MAKKTFTVKPLGLNTNANPVSLPQGAMVKALDVSLDRPGLLESRQAYGSVAFPVQGRPGYGLGMPFASPPGGTGRVYAVQGIYSYTAEGGGVLNGNSPGLTTVIRADGTSYNPYGVLSSCFNASGNDYILGDGSIPTVVPTVGAPAYSPWGCVFRIPPGTSSGRDGGAGAPEALTPLFFSSASAVTSVAGITITSTTPLSNQLNSGLQCAYRVLLSNKDPQNNLIRGIPSGRLIVYGPSLAYGLLIPLPQGQTFNGDILQVYRSEIVSTGPIEPSDEMRLCFEYIVAPSDVTNGYVVFSNDTSPVVGASLYTNDSQQGITQSEGRPPWCGLGVSFKGVAFYGAVSCKGQSLSMGVLSVSGWSTVTPTTITIASQGGGSAITYTMTAATSEDLPNRKFLLDTTSPTPALQLFNTVRSITRSISYQNPKIFAVYTTASNDITPSMVIKTVQVSDNNTWTVTLNSAPVQSTSPTIGPSNPAVLERGGKTSYLYYSKPSQPEAVPDLNFIQVGSPYSGIMGMCTIKDSLFIFKQEGLYRITGNTSATIRVTLFDSTIKTSPGQYRSISSGGNRIFAICNQGVVSITEYGAQVVSGPIDNIVSAFKNVYNDGLGSPFQVSGACLDTSQQYFLLLSSPSVPSQRLMVYNYRENMWSEWSVPAGVGCTGLCASSNGNIETLYISRMGTTSLATYSPIPPAGITYAPSPTFTYCMSSGDSPDGLQQFESVKLITIDSTSLGAFSFTFSSDSGAAPETVVVTNSSAPGMVRCDVPRSHARCFYLTVQVSCASGHLMCYGMIIAYDDVSDWMNSRNNS